MYKGFGFRFHGVSCYSGQQAGNKKSTFSRIKKLPLVSADKDISLQSIALSIGRVKACRNPKKEKPILDEKALRLLFDAPSNTKMGVRDKAIMILLYDSAARIDEILRSCTNR